MGERWEYEKEGFLTDEGPYLPDFFLPRLNLWLEVKGQPPTVEEVKKIWSVALITGCAGAIFHGLPSEEMGIIFFYGVRGDGGGLFETETLLGNDSNGEIAFGVQDEFECYFANAGMTIHLPVSLHPDKISVPCVRTDIALDAAKSARFENGERL